jgi:hypothetical protein
MTMESVLVNLRSWKTTVLGFIAGLLVVLPQIVNALDGDPNTIFSWDTFLTGLGLMGLGYFAKDGNKTSEAVKAKTPAILLLCGLLLCAGCAPGQQIDNKTSVQMMTITVNELLKTATASIRAGDIKGSDALEVQKAAHTMVDFLDAYRTVTITGQPSSAQYEALADAIDQFRLHLQQNDLDRALTGPPAK